MRLPLPSLRQRLLHFYIDNLVFRHEIGMNWLGRLRWSSPVIQGHLLMWMVLVLNVMAYLLWQWAGLFYASGGAVLVVSLAAHPVAFRRGYRSIGRERLAGSLEQLCLTLLTDKELFEGKYYGTLAPFLEMRRYLIALALIFCVTLYQIKLPLEVALCLPLPLLVLINHYMFSTHMGVMGGMASAAREGDFLRSLLFERETNAYLPQLAMIIRYGIIVIIVLFLTAVLFMLFFTQMIPLLVLMLYYLPFKMAPMLRDLEAKRRDRLTNRFKRKILFEKSSQG
jgi:hypothetical protein